MDESTTETSSSNTSLPKGLKKRVRSDKWEQIRRKRKRDHGQGYVTKKSKSDVPARKFVSVTNCCKKECHKAMNVVDQKTQFKPFYKLHKQDQDTFLMNHTERFNIKEACQAPKTKPFYDSVNKVSQNDYLFFFK